MGTKDNNQYDTVYIVGNGLDLSCNLKTSYSNFMENLDKKLFLDNELLKFLNKGYENKGWIDVEIELIEYAKYQYHNPNLSIEEVKKEFCEFVNLLKEYLKKEQQSYVASQWVSRGLQVIDNELDQNNLLYVLTFNYTYTIENYLSVHRGDGIIVNHIHGTLDNDIVIGVQDDADIPSNFSFLYKSNNVNPSNVSNIRKIMGDAKNIIFFGYSLGETDFSYFDSFFKKQCDSEADGKIYTFYYYGYKHKEDILNNLRMLTGNKLIEFYGNNTVLFKPVT